MTYLSYKIIPFLTWSIFSQFSSIKLIFKKAGLGAEVREWLCGCNCHSCCRGSRITTSLLDGLICRIPFHGFTGLINIDRVSQNAWPGVSNGWHFLFFIYANQIGSTHNEKRSCQRIVVLTNSLKIYVIVSIYWCVLRFLILKFIWLGYETFCFVSTVD